MSLPVAEAQAQRVTVSIIVDGDRMILSDGQRISLAGIDAPEKHVSPKLTQDALESGRSEKAVIRQGEQAGAYLSKIASGYPVHVKYVLVNDEAEYKPALVYVTDPLGHVLYSLNQQMIVAGFAKTDLTHQLSETRHYVALEKEAREERRGIWADTAILGSPEAGAVLRELPDPVTGSCARNNACVWVSNGTLAAGAGVWQSRPGRVCPCAVD